MVRRSTPQKKIDDRAFPVRILVRVPRFGFGQQYDEIHAWLKNEIGRGEYADHSFRTPPRDAVGFYFRRIEDAQRFVAAFPSLELSDETAGAGYTSPYRGRLPNN
ncbi:hypothetical protein GCM10011494_02830 [Novosphingobium endophyticum]|uniref:Uncharacterized protein n=1 Tax=Novosphingobium endophyticum TaxID=1955250 RepID=A0A916X3V9_9SPHN|nr:hypothetical protein [Novosphingobium endophyticum]GGB87922.1 hypothetical protein GCM10011494_02830 [Novosphingobium endophyticum]